jgi:hypothetical protein
VHGAAIDEYLYTYHSKQHTHKQQTQYVCGIQLIQYTYNTHTMDSDMQHMTLYATACAILVMHKYMSRIRNRHYLTSIALVPVRLSPIAKLLRDGDDKAYLSVMGIDKKTFIYIHDIIFSNVIHNQYYNRRKCDTHIDLAIAFHYLTSTMKHKTLCQLSGIPPATLSRHLRHTLLLLNKYIANIPESRIEWPSVQRMSVLAQKIENRQPAIKHSFGFVDGLSLPLADFLDIDKQNAYYNGYKSSCRVTNLIVFSSEGDIIFVKYNCPGSWHDSVLAQTPLYDTLLLKHTPSPYSIIGDTAFQSNGDMKEKILTPFKQGQISQHSDLAAYEIQLHQHITSVRQSVEWGMRSIQGVFARLTV